MLEELPCPRREVETHISADICIQDMATVDPHTHADKKEGVFLKLKANDGCWRGSVRLQNYQRGLRLHTEG